MKKRILSCLMALALCLTLLPTAALAAEEDTHTHCICGKSGCTEAGHVEIAFSKWLTSDMEQTSNSWKLDCGDVSGTTGNRVDSENGNGNWVLRDGYYYLRTDVENYTEYSEVKIDRTIVIRGDVTICLNGQTLESSAKGQPVFLVEADSTLTLTDCKGNTGKVKHTSDGSGSGVEVESGGTFNMYGGTITKNTATDTYGGGVYVVDGTFTMNGGTITDNTATNGGGGVYVSGGTFTMNGNASVTNNRANGKNGISGGVYVVDGTFTMNGGSITKNTANSTDGGVGVYTATSTTATFTMKGGTISGNNATKGGGVGVYRAAKFEMNNSASITDNTANQGGGVYVDDKGVYKDGATFTMNNTASVSGNTANQGGGVYVESGTFNMNDGTITGNTAKNEKASNNINGGGVYVSNNGTFNMNDGAITGNTATNTDERNTTYGGGVYVSGGTFTMNGGTSSVSKNTAKNGGGVSVSSGTFNMNDGTISGNTGNGVFVNGGTFTVSNTPTVKENTKDGAASNVCLAGSDCITIGGKLNAGASIGVTKTVNPMVGETVIAKGKDLLPAEAEAMFKSDKNGFEVLVDKDNTKQLVLKMKETQPSEHTHIWTYKASEATITATCANTDGNCDNKDGGSVIITPPDDLTYNGTEKPAMVKGLGNWKSAFSENISITYEQKNGNTYTNMNGVVPTKVGKYKASITVKGATASVVYEILNGSAPAEKTDPTYTAPTAKSGLVYTGENQPLIDPGSTNHGRMWYKLGTDDVYSTLVPMAKDAGSYTVYYKVEGDATHNDVAEKSIEVRIEKAQLSGTPTFTKVTEAGKTLKDVTLTKPKDWPEGTFEWGDGATETSQDTQIVQGQAYSWYYRSANHFATGKIVPWANPSSSGSSSGGSGSYDSNPVIKTETKNNADGSTTKTETRKDGSVTQTTTGKDGSVSKTETKKDGRSVTENKAADGSTGTVKTDKNGQTEANAKVSAKAVEDAKKSGEAVNAPVEVKASRNSNTAPTVKVELPKGAGETKVEIPVSNVKPGTVAVLVHPDGTEEILKNSIPTEDGIQLTVDGNATVKIIDNSKNFIDTRTHWAEDAIDFVSARGLVNGMSDTIYAPNNSATRAQLWTILARQNDANLSGGNTWYEKAQLWSKDKGISDGTEPNAAINRAQMVTMLWRTMGQPAATDKVSFADVPAGSYYAQAVAWAVENGITTGVGGGRFDPAATCTRAQIAAFLARLYAEK